ncbi:MAG: cbb3-type cytochrome c oxidase subunit II [Gallionellaceae bacterium]|jgi:cytochrome c oxidase cbb3-type subunit 2|nr:cbb3-type cytochrome c oxidase subunit II [Gallionellaceae bacterium]
MAFREYKIGSRVFGLALGGSMCITLFFPSFNMREAVSTEIALDKQLTTGWDAGWNLSDPFMQGSNKPVRVWLESEGQYAYVYPAGTRMPNAVQHPDNLGAIVEKLSMEKGQLAKAAEKGRSNPDGAVFLIDIDQDSKQPYIEYATATRGWNAADVLNAAADENVQHIGAGKSMFVREGCWWCHTLLPEQTQDWQVFGAPPMLGDFNGESPTAFGSDRKGPDLLHVGSRNASREWMMLHFFNPRLVQPHSIMPRFDYLWGSVDADGQKIDFDKWRADYTAYRAGQSPVPPDVPVPAKDSKARALIDFVLSLK